MPSLPYQEAPAFYQWFCTKPFVSALALRFLILTATRTSEVRFATYSEIDGDTWKIPANRTKTSVEHRVPLSDEAVAVIGPARQYRDQLLLFRTPLGSSPLALP
ncbi:MAG: tyrosine-type recombinase/integrase [Roseicyclus sp.]|uniref:tyrosine-type recombinase/integrase n=1 Tax=Boseongicola sp. H5 TaxID=2763261 RepID=UPI001B097FCB|nr:tyrosine-type recombinase/integrase [Roseicyclus sp.]MBO6923960.1 tyrosine-type recombinase/integrase [Roseicyclus sp.]